MSDLPEASYQPLYIVSNTSVPISASPKGRYLLLVLVNSPIRKLVEDSAGPLRTCEEVVSHPTVSPLRVESGASSSATPPCVLSDVEGSQAHLKGDVALAISLARSITSAWLGQTKPMRSAGCQ